MKDVFYVAGTVFFALASICLIHIAMYVENVCK